MRKRHIRSVEWVDYEARNERARRSYRHHPLALTEEIQIQGRTMRALSQRGYFYAES